MIEDESGAAASSSAGGPAFMRRAELPDLNWLTPHLLAANSPAEFCDRAAQVLAPLGLGLAVCQLSADRRVLQPQYISLSAPLNRMLKRAGLLDIGQLAIASDAPFFAEVLGQRRAVMLDSCAPLLQAVQPALAGGVLRGMLRFAGAPGCVLVPLLAGADAHGVLGLWGNQLPHIHAPLSEAFARQLALLLSQADLRAQVARQAQLIDSLAITAHAVPSIGTPDEMLRAVCEQAQRLLGASFASITRPAPATQQLECVMAIGPSGAHSAGMPAAQVAGIASQVMQSGQGANVPNVPIEPNAPAGRAAGQPVRSLIAQPLRHQGANLGVLAVGHAQPEYFGPADMAHLARYAEYAAIAIANAELLDALQQSEREQQRQQLDLTALLSFSNLVNASLDLGQVLHEGLRVVETLGLASMASALVAEHELTQTVQLAHYNIAPAVQAVIADTLRDPELLADLRAGRMRVYSPSAGRRWVWANPDLAGLLPTFAVAVPLCHAGQLVGVLHAGRQNHQPYTPRDLELLQAISSQLAQAVAKAQTHQTLQSAMADASRLYREAEAVRSYLTTLIQHTPALLLSVRPDGRLHVINPERLSRSAWSADMIEGRTLRELLPDQLHAELHERCEQVRAGQPQRFELELASPAGNPLHVLVAATLVADYDEVLMVVEDMTEQRASEAQLRQNEKLAAMGRMLAGTAHELNNPLAIILGLAQLQLGDTIAPELRTDMEKIERAALRARSIVQQLLSVARPQPLRAVPVALPALLADVLEQLAEPLLAYQIGVTVALGEALPPASGDAHQLRQVLFNVLNNAVQSLSDSTYDRPRQLSIRAQAGPRTLELTIEDNGSGIDARHQAEIFEPFFTTRTVGQGTGLGLALSHAIVQQHGGRIWVNSQPGHGATFTIQLPVAQGQPAEPDGQPAGELAGARVLVVQDEEALRLVLCQALLRQGCIVDAVASGAEALARAAVLSYQLVVSDLHAPGMDGPALYEQLRPSQPGLRWVMLTGDSITDHERAFLTRTGLSSLARPFTHEQLTRRARMALRGKALARG